jgi:ketosteroid isomerase-like protein
MIDIEKSVYRIIETYKTAARAKDVAAFMRLYDPKVQVFDAWGVWSYKGTEAWQVAVEGWFASLGSESVAVTFDEVAIHDFKDSAAVTAIVTYAANSSGNAEGKSMQNRLTWALHTSGHVLRIVHEHTSAPIGFEDQKAILHRGPAA